MKKFFKFSILFILIIVLSGCGMLQNGNDKKYKKSFELAEEAGYSGSYEEWSSMMKKFDESEVVDVYIEQGDIFIVFSDDNVIFIGEDEGWFEVPSDPENPETPEEPGDPENPEDPEEPGEQPEKEVFFNVVFVTDCDFEIEDQQVKKEGKIIRPADPQRDSYIFIGWYHEDQYWDFDNNIVTEDIELVAKWQVTAITIKFVVDQKYGYCSTVTMTDNIGSTCILPVPTVKKGYSFIGWKDTKTGEIYNECMIVGNENTTLQASFAYELTLYCDTQYSVDIIQFSESYILPKGTMVNGKSCIGWYDESDKIIYKIGDVLNLKEPKTLYALYEYNISFCAENYPTINQTINQSCINLIEDKIYTVPENAHQLIGWFLDEEMKNQVTTYPMSFDGKDIVLYGYVLEDTSFTINFETNGGYDIEPIFISSKFDLFVDELVYDFQNYGGTKNDINKNNFYTAAVNHFNDLFENVDYVNKYLWLFEYIKKDISENVDYNTLADFEKNSYSNAIGLLDELINGNFGYNSTYYYNFSGMNGVCSYIHRMLNKCGDEGINNGFNVLTTDYSNEFNLNKVMYKLQFLENEFIFKSLPIPSFPGYKFNYWCDINGNIVNEVGSNITLYASWDKIGINVEIGEANGATIFVSPIAESFDEGNIVYTTNSNQLIKGNNLFATLQEAINYASDGSVIYLAPGEYYLNTDIDKKVKIIGPNVDLNISEFKEEEAIISVETTSQGIILNAEYFEFNGLNIKGVFDGTLGKFVYDGVNLKDLVIKSCHISDFNTVFRFDETSTSYEVLIENCYFDRIGQFIVWATGGMTTFNMKGCYIQGDSCGSVVNSNAALFRIRSGIMNVENNIFFGNPLHLAGYFESSANYSNICFNVFYNVDLYLFTNVVNFVNFNHNLYFDNSDKPTVSPNGDEVIYKSVEELEAAYKQYDGSDVVKYPTIEEVRNQYVDKDVATTVYGVVTAKIGTSYYVQDGDFAVMIYNHADNTVEVGDKVAITGTLTVYNGLYEIKNVTKCEEIEKEFTAPVLVLTNENYNISSLTGKDNSLVKFDNLTYVSGKVTVGTASNIYFKTAEGTQVVLRTDKYMDDTAETALKAVVDGLATGDICNLQNVVLGWYNGPQLTPFSADSVVLVEKYDAPEQPEPEENEKIILDISIGENKGATLFVSPIATSLADGATIKTTSEKELTVGTNLFDTLEAALAKAEANAVIYLSAGEYELTSKLTKNLTLVGPNADLEVVKFGKEEAVITVIKDNAGNLAGAIEFNGIHIKGEGDYTIGATFQDGGLTSLIVKSCIFSKTNTMFKLRTSSEFEMMIFDCYIYNIGQFFLWVTDGMSKVTMEGCVIDGSTCGKIENAAAALFRVRFGSLVAMNNVFNGDYKNEPGYFECSAGASKVEFNTFNNVTKFCHPTATNNAVFNNNLYLDAQGDVVAASPNGDEVIYESVEELTEAYKNYKLYVLGEYPTIEEVRGQYVDKDVEVTVYGVVTAKIGNSYYVQDGDFAVMIYNHYVNTVNVGDKVAVTGTLTVYNGLYEVKNITNCEVVEAEFITPVLELTNDNYNATALAGKDNVLVSFKGVTYVSGKVTIGLSSNIIFKTVEGTEVVLRIDKYMDNTAIVALKAVVDELTEGDICDLQNLVLGWWNGPQLTPYAADSVIVVVKTSIV